MLFKLMILGGLSLLLLFALASIKGITNERRGRLHDVKANIARSYAHNQTLVGPVVILRYREIWTQRELSKQSNQWREVERSDIRSVPVFPKQLVFDTALDVEERYRGIFKANVFQSSGTLQGETTFPQAETLATKSNSRIEWVSAKAGVHISDPRGISTTPIVQWNNKPMEVKTGSAFSDRSEGFHIELNQTEAGFGQSASFQLDLEIHGMQRFEVVPIASDNQINLQSPWPHPSFVGDFLATTRSVTNTGFEAEWRVNGLATSAQQTFREAKKHDLQTLGVDLIDTVSPYPMTDRALKYGFLFIFLTFGAFFLFELLNDLQIHPIQYGFVGLAQALFFLLLLSLSEHMRFGFSYFLGAMACISVITFYLIGVLGNRLHGGSFGGLLALLYGSLFGLLQSEDHSLVAGSILLFGLLSGVMVLTRNIDWYALTAKQTPPQPPPLDLAPIAE